ncbi:bifunctional shikimate kinase/3-dehydroquinate synthase [Svornostia abyssi]|uniref:Shikimate kinase n=1 Tax=Svornostia abyssi TaxID=2898438 RepID=A0ABY5PDB8_9ACTN|nr:bifunctional shikimate kinase/3-dehydroquinate synthase [Parviterribacteraceae bacterium J379]
MARALVFVGFMGAGKSSAARDAAARLGTEPLDADEAIERDAGMSIAALFERDGEAAFREREERVVLELLDAAAEGQPVALGGGALGSARVRDALRSHTVALLEVSEETAWRRAQGGNRPLAQDRDRFAALWAERQDAYEDAADAFLVEGGRGAVVRALPALQQLATAGDGVRMAWATSTGGDYPVWFGAWPDAQGDDVLITDDQVAAAVLGERLVEVPRLTFAAGEEQKTLATAEALWRALASRGATRRTRVVAVGGGVVGDIAGFVAASYQRGIGVVHVPTTIVAQVDSAYGGKTGVDLPEGKNYVGAFHQPQAVHVLHDVLATLPEAERAAGYAEVVKTALIAGGPLWERVRSGVPVDEQTVLACARTKLRVVAADERDGGLRQILNLGHTVGHAIETVTGYARYRHGEAVALGLLAALRLSGLDDLREEVGGLLAEAGLPTRMDAEIDAARVAAATRSDKKRVGEDTPFVLVRAPGDVVFGQHVAAPDLLGAVQELSA